MVWRLSRIRFASFSTRSSTTFRAPWNMGMWKSTTNSDGNVMGCAFVIGSPSASRKFESSRTSTLGASKAGDDDWDHRVGEFLGPYLNRIQNSGFLFPEYWIGISSCLWGHSFTQFIGWWGHFWRGMGTIIRTCYHASEWEYKIKWGVTNTMTTMMTFQKMITMKV